MREDHTPHRRAFSVLLTATALVATPAFAEETTPVAPTPVQQAAPVAAAPAPVVVTPPPVVPTRAAAAPADNGESATPVNPEAAAQAAAEDQERRASARPAPRREARTTAARTAAAPTELVRTALAAPVPATPVASTPEPASSPAAAAPAAQPASQESVATRSTTTDTANAEASAPVWPWVLLGLVVIGAVGAFVAWRRRRANEEADAYWAEPATEDVYVAEPVMVAPETIASDTSPIAVVPELEAAPAEEAIVTDADAEDVAALTAADPVQDRPWLELAMRPLRAGASAEEAMVEIELTVGNAGAVRAEDVRISTFLLAQADDGEMERLLARPTPIAVDPVSIEPGEGTRVDATLAVPRGSVNGSFQPVVVADARYRLPDGSEGRTSASFLIGKASDADALPAIDTHGNLLDEDVEARLYGTVEHA